MAFFIGKNLTNVCTLWIIKTYTNLPVAVLVLIAFGAGIVFSLLLMMISKFRKSLAGDSEIEVKPKNEKSEKREKTERKLKKLKDKKPSDKKQKVSADSLSEETIAADKPV